MNRDRDFDPGSERSFGLATSPLSPLPATICEKVDSAASGRGVRGEGRLFKSTSGTSIENGALRPRSGAEARPSTSR